MHRWAKFDGIDELYICICCDLIRCPIDLCTKTYIFNLPNKFLFSLSRNEEWLEKVEYPKYGYGYSTLWKVSASGDIIADWTTSHNNCPQIYEIIENMTLEFE